jgi:methylated-DNA-[protein]-cysteine S-methyltransferase
MEETSEADLPAESAGSDDPLRVLLPSPIGPLGLELQGQTATQLVIVPKGRERRTFTAFSRIGRSEFLDEVLGRLSEYFAGARRTLQLDYDLRGHDLDAFARRVLRQTARIRYGDTRTYQQIAASAGRPDAYRNVLAVLSANPLPIVIPCHRVVTTKAGVGSYIGGARKKEWLLRMEARALASGRF